MVLGTRQHPLSGQIAMARAAACKPIYVLGGGKIKREDDLIPADFKSAVRTLRPADTLCVPYLYALADPMKAKRGFLSEYFNECIEEIEAPNRKPLYIELSSGLRSDDPKQRREMLRLARRAVIKGGKGLGGQKLGRKVLVFDADTLKACELIWRNVRDYRFEYEAEAAMKEINKRFTRQRARILWKSRKKRGT
jgi:hypothetical protein